VVAFVEIYLRFPEWLRPPGRRVEGEQVEVHLLPRVWWRFLAVPLAIWLLLTSSGTAGLLWAQHRGRAGIEERFGLRVDLLGDFVASYVRDLIEREQVQARTFLADRVVSQRDFARSVAGFGYPAAMEIPASPRRRPAGPPGGVAGGALRGAP
jgi:hypothetical protein